MHSIQSVTIAWIKFRSFQKLPKILLSAGRTSLRIIVPWSRKNKANKIRLIRRVNSRKKPYHISSSFFLFLYPRKKRHNSNQRDSSNKQEGRKGGGRNERVNTLLVEANKLEFFFFLPEDQHTQAPFLSFIIFQQVVIVWPVNLSVRFSPSSSFLFSFFRSDSSRTDVFRWVSPDLETVRSSNYGVQQGALWSLWTSVVVSRLASPHLSHHLTWTCLGGPAELVGGCTRTLSRTGAAMKFLDLSILSLAVEPEDDPSKIRGVFFFLELEIRTSHGGEEK